MNGSTRWPAAVTGHQPFPPSSRTPHFTAGSQSWGKRKLLGANAALLLYGIKAAMWLPAVCRDDESMHGWGDCANAACEHV